MAMLIEVELFQVVINETSDSQVVVLKEKGGKRCLPIIIGMFEALAINRKLNDVKIPRPLTHDLIESIIEKLGGKLERVIVNDLRDNTFYAKLEIRQNGKVTEIDSRPSDALALSVRTHVPIFVEESVFKKIVDAE
ncbi:MAG: bifunctional nuclease family protein [Planctomycetota bacterium]|nr:bifunctional nuclease family protein [Planctomycetota bacterium]